MALTKMIRKGDRVRIPKTGDVLIVHHLNRGVAWCVYEDGRLDHGVRAITTFIACFADGSLNQYMEHA